MMVGDALELINNFYVDPVDRDDLLTAAMDGMTGILDDHSSFIPGDAYESFQDSINQEFAGIGPCPLCVRTPTSFPQSVLRRHVRPRSTRLWSTP